MEGALCNCGHGFRNFSLQEFQRGSLSTTGMPNFAAQVCRRGGLERAQKRSQVPQAEASGYERLAYRGTGRVGFKDIYRRRDSSNGYRSSEREGSSERRWQSSTDGEIGRNTETSGESRDRRNSVVELASHVDTITSVQNPYVKHLVKLRQNTGYRNAAGCVLVVGSVPLR